MILLSDFMEDLKYGELNGVSLSGGIDAPKEIVVADYPKIITHLNIGLTNLFSKFQLKENEVIIQQFDDVTEYVLNSKHAASNVTSQERKWILDTPERPFQDDIIKITRAYDEEGNVIPVGDLNSPNAIFEVNYNTVQIPYPVGTNITSLIYRAKHPRINPNTPDLSSVELQVPEVFREALLWYVASRVHGASLDEASRARSVEYLQRYEARVAEVTRNGIFAQTDEDSNSAFARGGWL